MTVVTSVKKAPRESARQLLATKVELAREGEEMTVYRFRLAEDGEPRARQRPQPAARSARLEVEMTELTYLFATVAVVVGLVTSISIWAPRRIWSSSPRSAPPPLFLPIGYPAWPICSRCPSRSRSSGG